MSKTELDDYRAKFAAEEMARAEEDVRNEVLSSWLSSLKVGDAVKNASGHIGTVTAASDLVVKVDDFYFYSRVTGRGVGAYTGEGWSGIRPVSESDYVQKDRDALWKEISDNHYRYDLDTLSKMRDLAASKVKSKR